MYVEGQPCRFAWVVLYPSIAHDRRLGVAVVCVLLVITLHTAPVAKILSDSRKRQYLNRHWNFAWGFRHCLIRSHGIHNALTMLVVVCFHEKKDEPMVIWAHSNQVTNGQDSQCEEDALLWLGGEETKGKWLWVQSTYHHVKQPPGLDHCSPKKHGHRPRTCRCQNLHPFEPLVLQMPLQPVLLVNGALGLQVQCPFLLDSGIF